MQESKIITASIFSSNAEAVQALSNLREQCYKLASAYFNEGDKHKQKAAYALADKYQAVLEALNALDDAASQIRDADALANVTNWDD